MLTGHSEPAAPNGNKDTPLGGVSGGYMYTEMKHFYSPQRAIREVLVGSQKSHIHSQQQ